MDEEDPFETPEGRAWVKRANEELRPMIQDSAYTVGLISGDEPDAKQAVEMGFMILLGKPIILAVTPGAKVPDGLARAADAIVEADLDNAADTGRRLQEAIASLGLPEADDD